MPTGKFFLGVFAGYRCRSNRMVFTHVYFWKPLMGSQANDAFIFACLPIIAFYVSLWVTGKRAG